MDGYVVYDVATGEERWRGKGSAADQELSNGLAAMPAPLDAMKGETINLNMVKLSYCALIDAQTEQISLLFITPGNWKTMTYRYKAEEVVRWLADNNADVPYIAAEAEGLGVSVAERVAVIKARIDECTSIGSKINTAQQCAKDRIMSATNLGGIASAPPIDWQAVINPQA